jgi:antitoxin component YwqK of YwqJK toxin-antitoxin module
MFIFNSVCLGQNSKDKIEFDAQGRLSNIIACGKQELNIDYHSNGNLKSQFTFIFDNDSLIGYHGNRIDYYKNGSVRYASTYFKGYQIGYYYQYYESGGLKAESFFLPDTSENIKIVTIKGKISSSSDTASFGKAVTFESVLKYLPHGIWKEYFEDGKLRSVKYFDKGLEKGIWTWYYPNGQKKMEGGFVEEKIIIPDNIQFNINCYDCDYVMSNIYYLFQRKKNDNWLCWDKNGNRIDCKEIYK